MTSKDDDEREPGKSPEASHFFNAMESGFSGANEDAMPIRLALLEQEHSDLDAAIRALSMNPAHDSLSLARMKKRKLSLKDSIKALKDQLTPDIIA